MTRLLRPLAIGAMAATLITGVASAQSASGCSLVNTGPNSTNVCNEDNNSNLDITCKNNVDVVYINGQQAQSGNSAVVDNTSGGYAYSGNAVNTNSSTNQLDINCGPVKTASSTTTAPSQGKGAVAAAQTKAASLPNTGSNPLALTAIAAGALGVLAVVTRLGAKAYGFLRS